MKRILLSLFLVTAFSAQAVKQKKKETSLKKVNESFFTKKTAAAFYTICMQEDGTIVSSLNYGYPANVRYSVRKVQPNQFEAFWGTQITLEQFPFSDTTPEFKELKGLIAAAEAMGIQPARKDPKNNSEVDLANSNN